MMRLIIVKLIPTSKFGILNENIISTENECEINHTTYHHDLTKHNSMYTNNNNNNINFNNHINSNNNNNNTDNIT